MMIFVRSSPTARPGRPSLVSSGSPPGRRPGRAARARASRAAPTRSRGAPAGCACSSCAPGGDRSTCRAAILKHIHKGTIENAYTISNGEYEVIEAEIIESSELINKELKNSNLPDEIRIGAVLRNKKVIIPKSDFVFQKDDQIVLIVKKDAIGIVENLFRLSSV